MKQVPRWSTLACLALGAAAFLASISSAGAPRSPARRLENGKQIYLGSCAMCHGNTGDGDGPLATDLAGKGASQPAKLNGLERLKALGRAGVRRIILTGGGHNQRSNLMPPWADKLTTQQIDDVTDYVMTLPVIPPGTPAATVDKYLKAPPGAPDKGREVYVHFCSSCHGPEGKGDGVFARSLHSKYKLWPRNLTQTAYFANRTDQDLFSVISLGGGHFGRSTMMPAWTGQLKPAQIKNVVAYIRVISKTQPKP